MPDRLRNRIAAAFLICLLLGWPFSGFAQSTSLPAATQPADGLSHAGIHYQLTARQEPRPLRVHTVQVDLDSPRIELLPVLAADPDGDGPATAELTSPILLAQRASALVLVNCNPWQSVPDPAGKRSTDWQSGMHVQILGLAASHGDLRSGPADPKYCSVWLDASGRPRIGRPGNVEVIRDGVAGFVQLLHDGDLLHSPGGPIHPRTALGLDVTARYLYLVVVDGRQPGYSEGMSYFELATYMKELGCSDAVNLDGGGSSIMLAATGSRNYRFVNDPSTKIAGISAARPIPAALAVRERTAPVPSSKQ